MKEQKTNEQFLLVAVGLGKTQIVKQGPIGLIQAEKSRLQKEPQWRNFFFQVRTPAGYAAVKILTKKGQKK